MVLRAYDFPSYSFVEQSSYSSDFFFAVYFFCKTVNCLKTFFIKDEESILVFKKLRKVGKNIIGSIEQYNDRDSALLLKGKYILALRESFPQIKENEYYIIDLIGSKILDKKNNYLDIVKDIKNFGAGDLIEFHCLDKKNYYIPMNDDNLVNIDIFKKIIIVNPIDGILD